MSSKDRNHLYEKLSDKDFEMIKLEVELQEQRIINNESKQDKLRNFSIILWLAVLGVSLEGVNLEAKFIEPSKLILIGISFLVPISFMYLDAVYARWAQKLRSRRNYVTKFFNSEKFPSESKLETLPIFDFTGDLTVGDDPQTIYRGCIIVKLTRSVRLVFYGFQIFGSSVILGHLLAVTENNPLYYLMSLNVLWVAGLLYLLRYIKKRAMEKKSSADVLDEKADTISKPQEPN